MREDPYRKPIKCWNSLVSEVFVSNSKCSTKSWDRKHSDGALAPTSERWYISLYTYIYIYSPLEILLCCLSWLQGWLSVFVWFYLKLSLIDVFWELLPMPYEVLNHRFIILCDTSHICLFTIPANCPPFSKRKWHNLQVKCFQQVIKSNNFFIQAMWRHFNI